MMRDTLSFIHHSALCLLHSVSLALALVRSLCWADTVQEVFAVGVVAGMISGFGLPVSTEHSSSAVSVSNSARSAVAAACSTRRRDVWR